MMFLRNNNILLLFILTIVLVNPSIAGESHIFPNSSDFPTGLKNISHIESLRGLNNLSNNNNLYLFSWDDIPGNDTTRLINIIGNMFRIKWIKTATIEKIDSGMTIKVSNGNDSLSLKLNDDKTRVNLTINDVRTDEFIVRMNNNSKLKIYKNFMSKPAQAGFFSRNASTNIDQLSRAYNTAASTTPVHNINKDTNYVTIQKAIDNASAGDEINVDSGTYYENVNVTKRLILRGIGMPVVDAGGSGSAITLSANGIKLEGFSATGGNEAGIKVMSNNNTLIDNNASSNHGDYFNGYGIWVDSSTKNVLKNNIMEGNSYNFGLDGSSYSDFDNQIDTTNLVDGKSVYYIKGAINKVYDSDTNAGTFYCISCVNVTLKNFNLKNNLIGIFFWNTTHSNIQNVTASNNYHGISLSSSSNNTLIGNNASSNRGSGGLYNDDYSCYSSGSGSGISLSSSNNNTLMGNNANSNSGSGDSYFCDIAYGYGYGISLSSSNNNTLMGNNANSNRGYGSSWSGDGYGYGILLSASNNNTLSSNTANSNSGEGHGSGMGSGGFGYGYGILLSSSSNNTLISNNANSNSGEGYGSCCGDGYGYGISLSSSSNNMLNGNIANSNSGGGFGNYGSWEGHGISLSSSSNNKLIGNTANSHSGYSCCDAEGNSYANGSGILLSSSNYNTLRGNNVSNNNFGISLSSYYDDWNDIYLESSNNTLSGNIASSNSVYGIYLAGSSNNIYNNYFNNTIDLVINTGSNTWNTAKTSGMNIIGGPYLGGNFWAYPNGTGYSQTCPDADKDGICNAQYTLDSNNIDYLPLSVTWQVQDILSYYRGLGSDPNIVETTDLLKASDDWSNNIAPPGFESPITTQQLLMLADEWSKSG